MNGSWRGAGYRCFPNHIETTANSTAPERLKPAGFSVCISLIPLSSDSGDSACAAMPGVHRTVSLLKRRDSSNIRDNDCFL